MTRYSIEPGDRISDKGHRFLNFAKKMGKGIGENMSKKVSGKCSLGMLAAHQKLLCHAKQSATDTVKIASKGAIQKTAEATSALIGNKITNKITKNSPQNNLETDSKTEGKSKEIPKNIFITPEKISKLLII